MGVSQRRKAHSASLADDGFRRERMTIPTSPGRDTRQPGRGVTAVLGPTNTGKTHLAIERMLAHSSGVIGLPLRLLAREVYNRVVERVGPDAVALITGEEKIVPKSARYRVCTVEALPEATDASFLAIDEIQIAADLERGHVFTDRILNMRGRDETLLLGAATMRHVIEKLIPGVDIVTRPRMSVLTYAGTKKITRLPRRSAVVAFSADEVYAIGELIRRQRGGVAVVLGALSPRTRNAQVELYQSGDVDYIVATDAIGMGLNLDLDHVAFASDRKFDGYQYRRLTPAEFAQVAGRAGRHMRDGTFGVTGRVDPLEDDLVEALESHRFDPVKTVQWRNAVLDFSSLAALHDSLEKPPAQDGLVKAPPAEDQRVLEAAMRDAKVAALADRRERITLLWDVSQLPDYRRIAPANHADLVLTVYGDLVRDGVINADWFAGQIAFADRTDGDIDTLSNRIAHIRTWNYAANRSNWLADQTHWQERTRAIEDRLSDALHERLTQRFVDRRTSVLMRRLRENAMLDAEVTDSGDVIVEGQLVGQLDGFRFVPDPGAGGPDAKALRTAAQKALTGEIKRRADAVAAAGNEQFTLAADGALRWRGLAIARLVKGSEPLKPRLVLLSDEGLTGPDQEAVQTRLDLWLGQHTQTLLKPLFDLQTSEQLPANARGLAFRLAEAFGVIERKDIAEEVRGLEQDVRAGLRHLGVRFGAHHIYVPQLLKPGPSGLLAILWGLQHDGFETPGIAELPGLSAAGRTTVPVDPAIPKELYRVVGYRLCGERAVRIDILERLADLIRPLIAWKPTEAEPNPPDGAAPPGGFTVTPQMTSLLGASGDDFASVLKSLGYRVERKPAPPKPKEAASEPVAAADAETDTPPATEAIAEGPAMADAADAEPDALPATEAGAEEPAEPAVASAEADVTPPAEPLPVAAESEAFEAALAALAGFEETPVDVAPSQADGGDGAEQMPAAQAAEPISASDADGAAIAAEPAAVVEEEQLFIEIWRPVRSARRPNAARPQRHETTSRTNAPAEREKTPDGPHEERRSKGPRRGRPQRSERPGGEGKPRFAKQREAPARKVEPPRERPIDPDSPFAKLAALKADLERNRE